MCGRCPAQQAREPLQHGFRGSGGGATGGAQRDRRGLRVSQGQMSHMGRAVHGMGAARALPR
jgi:hypothetical protein